MAVLGDLVAIRHSFDGRLRPRLVWIVLPRRHPHRSRQPARPRPRGAALDEMGRVAFRRLRAHHGVRPARECLSVRDRDARRARRLDRRRDRRRLRLRTRQARLVPAPVSRQRRVRGPLATLPAALSGRHGSLVRERHPHSRSPGQLRADGAHPADDRAVGMPHVRALQRAPRRHRAGGAVAESRNRAPRSGSRKLVGRAPDRLRHDRSRARRIRVERDLGIRRASVPRPSVS